MQTAFRKLVVVFATVFALAGAAWAGDTISITLKYSDGKKITLAVEPDDTVAEVKQKASEQDKVPAEKHRLVLGGTKLDDEKTLADYGIIDGTELFVLFRL